MRVVYPLDRGASVFASLSLPLSFISQLWPTGTSTASRRASHFSPINETFVRWTVSLALIDFLLPGHKQVGNRVFFSQPST